MPLVLEYEDVLLRNIAESPFTEEDARTLIDYLCDVGDRQEIFFLWRPFLRDQKDDHVLELAVAAHCKIVTHNIRDFSGAESFGVEVMTPGKFLHLLKE